MNKRTGIVTVTVGPSAFLATAGVAFLFNIGSAVTVRITLTVVVDVGVGRSRQAQAADIVEFENCCKRGGMFPLLPRRESRFLRTTCPFLFAWTLG